MDTDESLTVEMLEGRVWPEPMTNDPAVLAFHEARRIPIKRLSEAQLLLVFDQKTCCDALASVILKRLGKNALALEGELLEAILEFFRDVRSPREAERSLLLRVLRGLPLVELEEMSYLYTLVLNAREEFGDDPSGEAI